ncbi:MAG: hypothetical protein OQK24_02820 [Magnetovibrio sp.]|nr:hypothetical protein [Magnetovibrio sp.]
MKPYRTVSLLILLMGLAACVPAQVQSVETDAAGEMQANDQTVMYHVSPAYFQNAPNCVIISPMDNKNPTELSRFVESTVARQLTGKIDRVISPLSRDRIAREQGYDLKVPEDLKTFARSQRCGFHLTITLQGSGDQFAVIWSDKRVGAKLELRKTSNDEVLWRGAHVARRGDGGIPLSPLSIFANTAKAVSFNTNEGLAYSIANDAVRRILTTLPDIR